MDAPHGCDEVHKEKMDRNYTRMLQVIWKKSWKQRPTKQQLCRHLLPIYKTSTLRRKIHTGRSWSSKDELIGDVLLWIPSHGRGTVSRPARTNLHQLCAGTGCSLEDLLGARDNKDGRRERERERERESEVLLAFSWRVFHTCVR